MRFLKIISLLPLALSLHACGKWAKANKTEVVTLPVPTTPAFTDDVFALNSPKAETEYKGTLIIFNDETTPELVADIINASIAVRDAWGAMKKFETENDYVNTWDNAGSVSTNLQLMREGLNSFEIAALNRNPISYKAKLENARTWISREIDSLGLNAEQRASFDKSWGDYCEAKVIEFAAHPAASQNSFKTFPYPAAICQEYYTAKSFFTGESCQNITTGDYTKCLWVEGVMKTRWFASPAGQNADLAAKREEKRNRLLALVSDLNYAGTRSLLGLQNDAFTPDADLTAGGKILKKKKDLFLNYALDQDGNTTNCPKLVRNAGNKDICEVFSLAKDADNPRKIIEAVEGAKNDEKIFTKLPAHPSGRSVTTQQLLQYLGNRDRYNTGENDRLFMELADSTLLPQPVYGNTGADFRNMLSTFRSILAAEFYGSLTPAEQLEKVRKNDAIAKLEADASAKRAQYGKLDKAIIESTDAGISAANAGNAAVGLLQYQLKADQVDSILHIQLWMATTRDQIFRACLDLATNLQTACPDKIALGADNRYYDASIAYAPDGGMIFEVKVTDPIAQGFGPKARADEGRSRDFFMDLPVEAWQDKTLRFELYRNRIMQYLDIMTGKVFIRSAEGKREYEGAISSWEQAE